MANRHRRIFPLWQRLYAPGSHHSMKAHPYLIRTDNILSLVLLSTYFVEWI